MASTLIALPLKSGEAFLLRTPDENGREWVILVDGGKAYGKDSRELAKILADVKPTIDRIDVVICTHSDADHSQGLWFLADDWYAMGRKIGEFWLPGRWANAVPSILTDPSGFVAKLHSGAIEAASQIVRDTAEGFSLSRENRYFKASAMLADGELETAVSRIDDVEYLLKIEAAFGEHSLGLGLTDIEAEQLRADFEETDTEIDLLETALSDKSVYRSWFDLPGEISFSHYLKMAPESQVAFAEVAETAKAIHKIATSALVNKIRVRWFDFGEYKKDEVPFGGLPGLLEPCCAVEVAPSRTKAARLTNLTLFHSLRLTRQNVESLVFYRPESDREPAVLFLGDSRLAHGIERPEKDFPRPFDKPARKTLITAPHHGSRNNDHAFSVLTDWLGNDEQLFVRNGGQTGQTLDQYLARKTRRCAQCVQCHGKEWNQWVSVTTDGKDWRWPPNANECGTPRT